MAFERNQEIQEQKDLQRILGIALGAALLIIIGSFWFYKLKQRANKKLIEQNTVIEQQKKKLEELDEAKSRFFTNISHEFRTPLTIISGMIDQVNAKPDLWLKKGSKMIKENTLSLLNLVNQILDLRKLESGALELSMVYGDVIQYLRYITESYRSFAENKGIQLHFLAAQTSIQMDYDPDKLLRITSNILSNAIKYTPEGGNIYFHLDKKNEKDKYWLQFRVEDTGSGIPEDQLASIFDRFYQVDDSTTRKGEGTGIGLALTRELVKLFDGEIEVESEPGKGTSFLIKLPITTKSTIQNVSFSPETNEQAISEAVISPVPESKLSADEKINLPLESKSSLPSLLVVEDNADVVQFLMACLETDYQLSIAQNGKDGIDHAIEHVPDLIVSDVMMPVKDGFELCETLKQDERTSHIPIILLTAKADLDSKISGLERGADAYLTKPFEAKELLVRLDKLLDLRRKLQARYRSFSPISSESNTEDEFIQKVRKAIESNIDDDNFGILQLCRAIALSRAQLHNKIKALTGLSTSIFIRTIRLQKGKLLLETSDFNVSEVAYEVGFKDPAYFTKLFTEEFGYPPSKTRK